MQKLAAAGAVPRGRHGPAPPQVRDGGYTCLLSAFFFPRPFPARVSLQFHPWQRHLIAATDSSQTPCKLLPASCVRFLSMSRQRPLGVLSASSQSSLGLLSASSHCFSARMYCLDSHVEPWRPLRTSSHRRRTRRSLHAFIIFPALRVHIPRSGIWREIRKKFIKNSQKKCKIRSVCD